MIGMTRSSETAMIHASIIRLSSVAVIGTLLHLASMLTFAGSDKHDATHLTPEIGAAHSAHWYNPERSGEGLVLEVLDENAALLYWFTYDDNGNQRWMIGTGAIVESGNGQHIEFPELKVTSGGRFGPDFDPDEVLFETVGQAKLSFAGCDQAVFDYQAFGQQETIPMTRLTRIMNIDCTEPIHGRPLMPRTDDAGLSGSWYDPDFSGQGFSLQWLDRNEALVIWYTYDPEGNQRWMIGHGQRVGDQVVVEQLLSSRGGRFGEEFDPGQVELLPWGELTLESDCESGALAYSTEFGEGAMQLTPLTRLKGLGCPLDRPKVSDLYDFEVIEEIPVGVPGLPVSNRARAMSDDGGTVVGRYSVQDGWRNWRWQRGKSQLEELPGVATHPESLFVSPDGGTIYATFRDPPDGDSDSPRILSAWQEETGWQPLDGTYLKIPVAEGLSRNGTYLVGRGQQDRSEPWLLWKWHAEEGQQEVASEADFDFGFTRARISDDGRTIVGLAIDLTDGSPTTRRRAVRWIDGEPELLQDGLGAWLELLTGCADECRILFGGGQHALEPDHPHAGHAWFWSEQNGAEYIERMPQARDNTIHSVFHTSADGSLMTGSFGTALGTRGFVWTRATGAQPLTQILTDLGIVEAGWWDVSVVNDVSPDGLLWLVSVYNRGGPAEGNSWAGLIQLTPQIQPHQ